MDIPQVSCRCSLCSALHYLHPALPAYLPLSQVLKFCMTLLAITLPLSSGMFTPVFSLGAALGRAFGEMMALVITTQPGGTSTSRLCIWTKSHLHSAHLRVYECFLRTYVSNECTEQA